MTLPYSFFRLLAVIGLLVFHQTAKAEEFQRTYLAMVLGHYTLAFYYSRNQMKALATRRETYLSLFFLTGFLAWMIYGFTKDSYTIPIEIYFCLHTALSDTYLFGHSSKWLSSSRFWLNFAVMSLILHATGPLAPLPLGFYLGGVGLCFGLFLIALVLNFKKMDRAQFFDLLGFEIVGVLAALGLISADIDLREVVFYHVILWFIIPLKSSLKGKRSDQIKYVVQTLAVTVIYYAFVPQKCLEVDGPSLAWGLAAIYGAYIHSTASLALSRTNPVWIQRFFRPEAIAE